MDMEVRHLLMAGLLVASVPVSARDIHGVKGFYNWTAAQMQQDGFVKVDPKTGNKDANWLPAINFDNGYLNSYLGVGDAAKNWWRTTAYFNYRAQDAGITITKNYPVLAFKFSLPENVTPSTESSVTMEHWWKNPYDGSYSLMNNKTGLGINGLASNGRLEYIKSWPGKTIVSADHPLVGRDSVKLGWEGNYTKYRKTDDGVVYAYRDVKVNGVAIPTFTCAVLPETGAGKTEYIAILNYGSIEDTVSVENGGAASRVLLDRTNIESVGFHIMFFGYKTIDGCDAAPEANIKWVKTFAGYEEAMASLTADNNWGDGTESAAKTQLNYALYYAEQILKGYSFRNSDPDNPDDAYYIAYQTAYTAANGVYTDAAATDADYENATAQLQAARVALMTATNPASGLVYNYLKSATGSGSIVIGADNVTVGGITGKPLTVGSNDAAAPLSFVATGNVVNGQKTYTLRNADGAVMQANDGTLLLVKDGSGSVFTFSERDVEGHGFDIKCGDRYYYLDSNGLLACTAEIPEEATVDFDALSSYLFTIDDALADYVANASEEEKTGLTGGWEFNSTPAEDPGTRGVIDGVVKVMAENSATRMIDGWRMSRWRAYSRVNQETVKNSDNTDAVCLVLTSAPTYDNWDGSQTGIAHDFTTPAAMRMDAGTENPFYVRDPNPRDSTWAYCMNAGVKRYFAIKMKATDDVAFGTLTFLGANTVTINSGMIAGQKGDVVYWDLLQSGFAVGKNLFTSAFFSPTGFTSADSKLYIDWIRTYATVDEIPEESLSEDIVATGIRSVNDAEVHGAVTGEWFNLNGQRVSAPSKGLYIQNGKKVIVN